MRRLLLNNFACTPAAAPLNMRRPPQQGQACQLTTAALALPSCTPRLQKGEGGGVKITFKNTGRHKGRGQGYRISGKLASQADSS